MHVNSYIPSRKPQLTAQDMILSEGVPCGPDCFRHIQDFERFMVSTATSRLLIMILTIRTTGNFTTFS